MKNLFLYLALIVISSEPASAMTYKIEGDIVGTIEYYEVKDEDNLYEIARRYDLGIVELLAANPGVDPWEPEEGTVVTIPSMHLLPATREDIVLNLSELRLFYFPGDGKVYTFPVGIGRDGWQTPIGETTITLKRRNPIWIPPQSIKEENPDLPDIVPAGPHNPLGDYALNLSWTGYRIHGTNKPYGVGKRSSHGCIRLYPEDIKLLFSKVKLGTKVTIIDTDFTLAWHNDVLYLKVTNKQSQVDIIANSQIPDMEEILGIEDSIRQQAGSITIDWGKVNKAVKERKGIPVPISQNIFGLQEHGLF